MLMPFTMRQRADDDAADTARCRVTRVDADCREMPLMLCH